MFLAWKGEEDELNVICSEGFKCDLSSGFYKKKIVLVFLTLSKCNTSLMFVDTLGANSFPRKGRIGITSGFLRGL